MRGHWHWLEDNPTTRYGHGSLEDLISDGNAKDYLMRELNFRREKRELSSKLLTMANREFYEFHIIQFSCDFIRIFLKYIIIIYFFTGLRWGLHLILPQGLCFTSFGQNASRLAYCVRAKYLSRPNQASLHQNIFQICLWANLASLVNKIVYNRTLWWTYTHTNTLHWILYLEI